MMYYTSASLLYYALRCDLDKFDHRVKVFASLLDLVPTLEELGAIEANQT